MSEDFDRAGKIVHVDLGPFGYEGQWIDVRNPKFITERALAALVAQLQARPAAPPPGLDDATKAAFEETANAEAAARVESAFRSLLVAWRIVDEDSGAALVDPATDDLAALTRGHTKVISDTFWDLYAAQVPKALRRA